MSIDFIVIKIEYLEPLEQLGEKECGGLILALLHYFSGEEKPKNLTYGQSLLWSVFVNDIERAISSKERRARANSENGKKSASSRAALVDELSRVKNSSTNPAQTNKHNKQTNSLSQTNEQAVNENEREDFSRTVCENECENFSDKEFETFWNAYPRKIGRKDTEQAFQYVLEHGTTLQSLLDGVSRARVSRQWTQEDGRFIPAPLKWLTDKGWMTEYDNTGADCDSDDDITV